MKARETADLPVAVSQFAGASPPPVDVTDLAAGGIDVDFHPSAGIIPSFDLPFVAGKLGVGHRCKAKVGRNVQRGLHGDQAAGIIGQSGLRHAKCCDRDNWDNVFSHKLLLIVTLLTSARCLKPLAAFCVPALHNDEAELVHEESGCRISKSDTVGAKSLSGFD
jgi:hypothetical protein